MTAVVAPPASVTTFAVSPMPGYQAHALTLVAGVSGPLQTPTGTVELLDGTTMLQQQVLREGTATFTTTALARVATC